MEYNDSLLLQRDDDADVTRWAGYWHQPILLTLHCAQCNTVLGDSFGICGEMTSIDAIICIKVTSDVVISGEVEWTQEGAMADCIHSSLKCRVCQSAVGKIIHSSPSHLDMVRSLFLLYKANSNCYILDTSSMVKASTLTFDMKPLKDNINEVRQQLNQMSYLISSLDDMSLTSEWYD